MILKPRKPLDDLWREVLTALLVFIALFFLLVLLAPYCRGDKPEAFHPATMRRQPNQYRLDSVTVYDGDTITANINLGFSVFLGDQSIRLKGFDAWEITRRRQTVTVTDAELELGKIARQELIKIIGQGDPYFIPGESRDPYGRLLGWVVVYTDGKTIDIATLMRSLGHDRDEGVTPRPP